MPKVRATDQRGLWEFTREERAKEADIDNLIGPFEIPSNSEAIPRNMDCSNYDHCLDFAASRNWGSFSCSGCRKALSGKFITPKKKRTTTR